MSYPIDARLAVLSSYYVEIDELIATEARILDTYEGMLSHFNNAEGADHVLAGRHNTEVRLADLRADRAEIDRMWNEALTAAEGV